MLRFSLTPFLFLILLGSTPFIWAQDFRKSHNFDLQKDEDKRGFRNPAPQDGPLSEIEYERRKLEYMQKNAKQMGVDPRILERQLKDLEKRALLEQQVLKAEANELQWQEKNQDQNNDQPPIDYNKTISQQLQGMDQQQQGSLSAADRAEADKMLAELQELQEKMKTGDASMSEIFDKLNKISGSENIPVPAKYEGHMSEQLYKALSSMRSMSAGQLEKQLEENLSKHPAAPLLSKGKPLIPDIVKVLQSPEALPDTALILSDRSKLIKYLVWNIAIFILNIFLRRRIRHSQLATFPKFMVQTTRWAGVNIARISLFMVFFGDNVKVLWQILTN